MRKDTSGVGLFYAVTSRCCKVLMTMALSIPIYFSVSSGYIAEAHQLSKFAKSQTVVVDFGGAVTGNAASNFSNSMIAFNSLPKDFNAEAASDSDLAEYGLPPRPDKSKSPEEYQQWMAIVDVAHNRIVPELVVSDIYHDHIKGVVALGKKTKTNLALMQSTNWSGFVINDTNNIFQQHTNVTGSYNVPMVADCVTKVPNIRTWSSNWVGIDGYSTSTYAGSTDVFQIGTSSDAACNEVFGGAHGLYYAWIEWFPGPAAIIKNLPIYPGDSIVLTVSAGEPGKYVFTIADINRRASMAIGTGPYPGSQFVGNSIEWIVEAPTVGGSQSTLAPYLNCAWQNISANVNGVLYRPSLAVTGTSYSFSMIDSTSSTVSTPTLYPALSNQSGDLAWFISYVPL